MIIDEWLVSKLIGSTTITQYTTRIYPEFIPESTTVNYASKVPCITYQTIGFDRNRLERNRIFSLTSVHNSKSNVENMNDQLYNLFDTSTAWIRESSSNLYVDSVDIINNVGLYDPENRYWTKILDISVWYHK